MFYFHMNRSSFSTPHHSRSTISATIFGFLVIPQKNGLHIRNQHPQLPPYPSKPQNAHFYPYFPKFFTKSENLKNCLLIPYYSNIIIFIDRETEISTRFSVFTEWKKFFRSIYMKQNSKNTEVGRPACFSSYLLLVALYCTKTYSVV